VSLGPLRPGRERTDQVMDRCWPCSTASSAIADQPEPRAACEIIGGVTIPPPVTVGELFPADDLVARWVFSLSAVLEDLAMAEEPLGEALERERGSLSSGYHYRHLIARLYEAERPIIAALEHVEVRDFLDGIADAQEPLAYLTEHYKPLPDGKDYKVRHTFGGTRHRAVHHSWPASAELRQALQDAADEGARILVNLDGRWVHHDWPEAVAARTLVGDLSDPAVNAAFVERLRFAQEVLRELVALFMAVLGPHLARVRVDPRRLVHHVE
jgi:hypothetical protein